MENAPTERAPTQGPLQSADAASRFSRERVSAQGLKAAIEGRDGARLAGFYAEDAEMRVIDRVNPPSRPRLLQGRAAIAGHWADVCGRAMTHEVDFTVTEGDRLAFSQACAYPDGTRVACLATLELQDGRIARQTIVQAWDE